MLVDIFWLVVGGGGYTLAGGGWWWIYFGWWWVVVDGGGWWHSLVLPKKDCRYTKKSVKSEIHSKVFISYKIDLNEIVREKCNLENLNPYFYMD